MSETPNQLNPQQVSGAANPNTTKSKSPQSVSPGATTNTQTASSATNAASASSTPPAPAKASASSATTTPSTAPAKGSSPVAFHSDAIGTQTARPKDYFAEQNQQRAQKKQTQSARNKKIIIIACAIIGVLLIAGAVWMVVALNQPLPAAPEGYDELTATEKVERNSNLAQDIYDTATENSENNNDSNTDEQVSPETIIANFDRLIDQSTNTVDLQVARITKMQYLILQGDHNQVIEVANTADGNVCDFNGLDARTQMACYNFLALAYQRADNQELGDYYMEQTTNVITNNPEVFNGGE